MGSAISYYLVSSSMQNLSDYIADEKEKEKEKSYYNKKLLKCYKLFVYLQPELSESIKQTYIENAKNHNQLVDSYLFSLIEKNTSKRSKNFLNSNNSDYSNYSDYSDYSDEESDNADYCLNAGFDLICPNNNICDFGKLSIIDHQIITCMKLNNKYVSYYLYSRSSTPIKTPLRLANNVGIIDSGYRGNIKALFDCIYDKKFYNNNNSFILKSHKSYVQICSPNI